MQPTNNGKETLGTRLRNLRLELNLSQDRLAAGRFTKSYISALERDKVRPSLKALIFIAERLGTTPADLLRGTPEQPKTEHLGDPSEFRGFYKLYTYRLSIATEARARLLEAEGALAALEADHPEFLADIPEEFRYAWEWNPNEEGAGTEDQRESGPQRRRAQRFQGASGSDLYSVPEGDPAR
jgi:transcriptional regulator with XRE-family HTH domain